MATLSPLERNVVPPACTECDAGERAEQCAACFVKTVRLVIANCGSTQIADDLAQALADLIRERTGESARPLEARFGLTRSQSRVAQLLAEGHPNKEIARRLYISPHTARHHTQHLMLKLGARSRTAAAAIILGL